MSDIHSDSSKKSRESVEKSQPNGTDTLELVKSLNYIGNSNTLFKIKKIIEQKIFLHKIESFCYCQMPDDMARKIIDSVDIENSLSLSYSDSRDIGLYACTIKFISGDKDFCFYYSQSNSRNIITALDDKIYECVPGALEEKKFKNFASFLEINPSLENLSLIGHFFADMCWG